MRCEQCGERIDARTWHPAVYCEEANEIHDFCSTDCKRVYRRATKAKEGDGPQPATGEDG